MLKADEPKEFAEAVLCLLRDSGRRHTCGLRARQSVEQSGQWSIHGAALEALLEELVRNRRTTGRCPAADPAIS
jgi:hypothetical protein